MKLTKQQLDTIDRRDKVYKVFDGHGLYIEVPPHGSLRWRYKYNYKGNEKRISLGIYPKIGVTEARKKHMEMREKLSNGLDPSIDKSQTSSIKSKKEADLLSYIWELEEIIKDTRKTILQMLKLP